ncbi:MULTISPECIES: Lrp/AsnC family transcriptional regulator [unclassified Shinella]|jgi:DNA-binding Lrp family transcriptional regulator|uniref:Lrp/AsnC family transcriptional regulator n=1 Tax=unclassified Shinella TaxID=2643062 RepID=UPI0003C54877|nr:MULTISPECIES: Lrp/AsnC family transcriptional regulator [unclassified Shinella]MCA0338978.1 Lrp/AsnC family transcriptional regulator [Pseudomonadota bacterium]EYR81782.1 transcriptional regulator, AsnC family [Shinella sp. DD12]MCO5149537.1 Lrp/AsnC family transcriptional regulator [Shinella sp.]MDC7262558.1 Lrp/AsnC family transcriptional regulator [Shinella sp. HY16]MDC7269453.1 Lrp/AsnC family transcriptional regulator [Shinella sp. YZ44]
MDTIDRKLLALLRKDGRASLSALAEELKVSRGTVQNRMERLTRDGVIAGFSVRVTEADDPHAVRAIMMIEITGQKTLAAIQALRGLPEVRALHTTNGAWDLVAEIHADNLVEFERVLRGVRAMDGVSKSETSLLLTTL